MDSNIHENITLGLGELRLAGVVRESIVDGPGLRFVIFCQGCPHGCEGCHNPDTHDFDGGYMCSIDRIMAAIDQNPLLRGVTFSGGEPMCQPEAFLTIAKECKKRKLSVMCYSGYTYEELMVKGESEPAVKELMSLIDYLVDGRFELGQRDLSLRFRGSKNQRYIDMNRTREQGIVTPVEED